MKNENPHTDWPAKAHVDTVKLYIKDLVKLSKHPNIPSPPITMRSKEQYHEQGVRDGILLAIEYLKGEIDG